jgi:dihydroflavonol-4-reductase
LEKNQEQDIIIMNDPRTGPGSISTPKKNRVLVTGGTGFLGAYIIKELLDRGHAVRAIRRNHKLPAFIPASILEKAEWVDGNILDLVALEEAMDGIDAVIHSAAVVSFYHKDKKKMMKVNTDGTANVVNMALEKNVKRLIHISSVAALGRNAVGGHVNEEKKWEDSRFNTDYARSKHKGELEIWRGVGEGLESVILNPSTILGYGDWNSSSCAIFKSIYKEFKWYTPGLNGFVDVEDVARIAVLFLENNISGERFIVNGDNWTFKQLQETIAEKFRKKKPSKQAAGWMLSLAWRMERLRGVFTNHRPLITKESAKVAMSKTWFENDKLLLTIPQFSFTPLDKSIEKACEKYLSNL